MGCSELGGFKLKLVMSAGWPWGSNAHSHEKMWSGLRVVGMARPIRDQGHASAKPT